MDKLERQLAAVGVRGQCQVDAQLGSTIEDVGIVAQKDVDHVRHHQFFASLEIPVNKVPRMIIGEATALVVNTDQVQHFAMRLNGYPFLTQDANPLRGKQSRDGVLGFGIDLMVAEAAENTEWRTKARERLSHFTLRLRVRGDIVADQRHQVGGGTVRAPRKGHSTRSGRQSLTAELSPKNEKSKNSTLPPKRTRHHR